MWQTLRVLHKPFNFIYSYADLHHLPRFKRSLITIMLLSLVFLPTVSITSGKVSQDLIDADVYDESLLEISNEGFVDKNQTGEMEVKWQEYIAMEGDTFASIAEQFGIEQKTLEAVNHSKVGKLKAGMKLYIPPYDGVVMHLASRGESLLSIASLYSVDPEVIKLANDGAEKIVVGEYYLIPGAKAPARDRIVSTGRSSGYRPSSLPGRVAGAGWSAPLAKYTYIRGYFKGHTGVDISAPKGSPIYAIDSGVVMKAPSSGYNGGYGLYVLIKHDNGLSTLCAHMSQVNVQVGETVSKGQVIGLEGSTGRSTGPHVHVEVHDSSGRKLNPANYINF